MCADFYGVITPYTVYGITWPSNVWAMATVENQRRADERISLLKQVPAAVRGLSLEPMLGPIVLPDDPTGIHCVIVGGESGANRRPFNPAWARGVRDWCIERGVSFFYKQGSYLWPGRDDMLNGRNWTEIPR